MMGVIDLQPFIFSAYYSIIGFVIGFITNEFTKKPDRSKSGTSEIKRYET